MGRAKVLACLHLTAATCLISVFGMHGCEQHPRLVIASKNFTEQVILGEILAQHIERRLDIQVDRRLNLGGTLLAHQALIHGDIDLYPEYTGTALTAILKLPPSSDPNEVLTIVRSAYRERWGIDWLEPLGFNNTFAIVVRGDDARRHKMTTVSDAAARPGGWKMGMGYEFQQRPDGLKGFLTTYHLALDGRVSTMDLGLLYQALEHNQVNMVAANSTDGLLTTLDVHVLVDDQHYFPPYHAAIAVRTDILAATPGLREALDELSGQFTEQIMQNLNYQVDGQHRPVSEVAREFLASLGTSVDE